ncbi:MAG: hypothetical protein U0935_04915 [Pirellulales bacterium]
MFPIRMALAGVLLLGAFVIGSTRAQKAAPAARASAGLSLERVEAFEKNRKSGRGVH